MKSSFVYVLKCADGTLYTGWTVNIEKRLLAHNKGVASKYTRTRLPVELVYSEALATRKAAMQREYEIKQMKREGKLSLIASGNFRPIINS